MTAIAAVWLAVGTMVERAGSAPVMKRPRAGGAARRIALVAGLLSLAPIACGGDDRARVEPAVDEGTWRKLAQAPGATRRRPQELASEKIGSEAVLIAGIDYGETRVGGLRYDVEARRWRSLRRAPLSWRAGYAAAAVGDQIVVWGGTSNRGNQGDGARYDVGDDRWRKLGASPLQGRYGHSAVSTGDEVIFFGGARTPSGDSSRTGAVYTPAGDSWRRIPRAPLRGRRGHVAVWTGDEMIVWGGYARELDGVPRGLFDDGAAFDPARRAWKPLAGAPVRATEQTFGLWLGDRLFVFNGSTAALYDPGTDEWRLAAAPPLPENGVYEAAWTGERVLMWWTGEARGSGARGAAYDPARDAWIPLPEAPLSERGDHVALWTGRSLLVWGGCCSEGGVVDGAHYFPAAGG